MSVIFILIDGLRPDALHQAKTPTLDSLMQRGAYALTASSVMPSITLPCHMSIFHSVPPTRHGITTNTWMPMARPLPGLVEKAKDAGLRSSFFYNWEPLRNLSQPGSLSFAHFSDNLYSENGDAAIAEAAAEHIRKERPDFAFVYLGQVDIWGHGAGWMSAEYLAQVEHADCAVAQLVDACQSEDTLLIQSDHGGHDRTHGTDSPDDMQIPWMVVGPNIRQGLLIQQSVTLLDTAPTLARLLGITAHPEWEGTCVEEIFI